MAGIRRLLLLCNNWPSVVDRTQSTHYGKMEIAHIVQILKTFLCTFLVSFYYHMQYNGNDDETNEKATIGREVSGMKKASVLYKWLLCTFLVFGVLVWSGTDVSAAGTGSGSTESKIKYTTKKVKEKIVMLPGETRMISAAISPTATYSSSNTKIVTITNSGMIKAKKAGTAKITQIDGTVKTIYTVKINNTVDLIVFAGQSNMVGAGGSYRLAPTPEYGTAYEFDVATNTKKFLAMREPFGEGTARSYELQGKDNYSVRGTLASAFCINYYKQTKTPVVGIPCFWGGSSTKTWLNGGLVKATQKNVKLAKKQLKKNKINVRHIYMVWYQGETDAAEGVSASKYISNMQKIFRKMKTVGVEKMFVITIGKDTNHPDMNNTIISAQKKMCSKYNAFIMASKTAPKLYESRNSYYSDCIHLNQYGLNKIGYEAGKVAGNYAKKHSKKK